MNIIKLLTTSGLVFSMHQTAMAQTVQSGGIDEIIVSAQKRSQSLQDVPIAVTAFQADELEAFDFSDPAELASQTPNMQVSGAYQQAKPVFSLRGISFKSFNATDSQAVGVYNDEVFIASRSGQLFQMFDLERVEVLRGPQGTLFGKNTTGGAISFFARRPSDEFEANGSVTYGRFNQLDVEAGISVPVVEDKLAVRLSTVVNTRDGTTLNEFNGEKVNDIDNWAGRALAVFRPNDTQEWTVNVHGGSSEAKSSYYHSFGIINGADAFGYIENPDFYTLSSDIDAIEKIKNIGSSLTGEIDFNNFSLTTISAYENTDYSTNEDSDGGPFNAIDAIFTDNSTQYSQELRLTSDTDGPFNWMVGAYYLNETLKSRNAFNLTVVPGGAFSKQTYKQKTDAYAGFAQIGYELSDRLRVTVGGRWTHESKDISFSSRDFLFFTGSGNVEAIVTDAILDANAAAGTGPARSNSWSAISGKIGLDYNLTDDVLLYGSYSRGFKSGGYNGIVFSPGEFTVVDPEFVNAYEIGFKSDFYGRRLIVNAAAFYNSFSDLQLFNFISVGGLPVTTIENASSAVAYGAEIEIVARPVDDMNISLGLGLVDTEITDVTASGIAGLEGNKLALAPSVNLNGTVDYRFHLQNSGSLKPRFEFNYVSQQFFSPDNNPISSQDGYWLLNANLTYQDESERYSLTAWVKNLGETEYLTESLPFTDFGLFEQRHGDPRTYGITLRAKFD